MEDPPIGNGHDWKARLVDWRDSQVLSASTRDTAVALRLRAREVRAATRNLRYIAVLRRELHRRLGLVLTPDNARN
jgi:hypothetical protein